MTRPPGPVDARGPGSHSLRKSLWVPSHQGVIEDLPQRQTAVTGRRNGCSRPAASTKADARWTSTGPPGHSVMTGDVRVGDLVESRQPHEGSGQSASRNAAS